MEEKEIKVSLDKVTWDKLKSELATKAGEGKTKLQKDVYFDNADLLLTNLARGLRIRYKDDVAESLEFKSLFRNVNAKDGRPFYVEEIIMPFPLDNSSQEKLVALLKRMGLGNLPVVKTDSVWSSELIEEQLRQIGITALIDIDKNRTEFTWNGAVYVFDYIENLGYFLEIEVIDTEKSPGDLLNELIDNSKYTPLQKGYNEMFLEQKDNWVSNQIQHQLFRLNPRWNILQEEQDLVSIYLT